MLKIRLTRTGRKNSPKYRVVVIDSRKKRDGEFTELIGHYDPETESLEIKNNRLDYWLSQGAQLSPGADKIIRKGG